MLKNLTMEKSHVTISSEATDTGSCEEVNHEDDIQKATQKHPVPRVSG